MLTKIKSAWDYLQGLLDIDGDVIMLAFTLAVIVRVILVVRNRAPLNMAEATAYGSAIAALGYSKGPKGPRGA